jgi:rsbT co-antagonist protein RsbR
MSGILGTHSPSPADATGLLESIVEASTEHAIVGIDPDGTILLWNSGAHRLYGYPAADVVGERTVEVLHTPEDVAAGLPGTMRQAALADGAWKGTLTQVRRDHSRIAARAVLIPRRDRAGQPTGFVLISNDLCDELPLTQELEARLLEEAPDALVVVDPDGRIVLVNRQTERLFGYRRSELLGRPVEVLAPEQLRASHAQRRRGYRKDPRSRPMGSGQQLFGWRKDGSQFPADISLSPLRTDRGTLVSAARHLLALIDDVLDIAAIESNRLVLSLEPVAVADVLAEAVELVRSLAGHPGRDPQRRRKAQPDR